LHGKKACSGKVSLRRQICDLSDLWSRRILKTHQGNEHLAHVIPGARLANRNEDSSPQNNNYKKGIWMRLDFLKIDFRKCSWPALLAALLIFLYVSSCWAVEQKSDRLSLSEFQQQFEQAFIKNNSMRMDTLASSHRDFLRLSISNLLKKHIQFTLNTQPSQAHEALRQAFALAEFARNLSNDVFPSKQIHKQSSWSKAELELKMQADTLLSQCETAFNQGLYEKTLPLGTAVVEIYQKLGSDSSDGTEMHLLGKAERKLAHYEKAMAWHKKALALAEENEDRLGHGRALIDLADVYERKKDHTRAIKFYRQALELLKIPEEWRQAGRALRQLGDVYVANGEFEEAYQAYGQAVRYAEDMDDVTLNAEYHDYSGYFYRRLGSYAKAVKAHNRALDYAQRIPDETIKARALARAYNHLGLCLEKQAEVEIKNGNSVQAEKLLRQGVESEKQAFHFADEVQERWRLGYVLRALASLYRHLGDLEPSSRAQENYDQSLTYARQALALGKEMQEKEWQGQALHAIGMVLGRMNRDQEGLDALKKAIETWDAIGDLYLKGHAHRIIAYNFHEKAGRFDEALASYNVALDNFRSICAAEYVAAVHLSKGMLYEKKGDLSNAQTAYMASIDTLEGIRKKLTSEEHKLAFFERRLDPYEALIRLLIKKYRQTAEIKYGQMAVEISERSRSRATLDLIQEASGKIRAGVDDATLEREQFLRSQIYIVTRELLHKREPHQIDELRNRLESLELDYNHLLRNLEKQYPAYAELKHPKNLDFHEIKNVLKDGEFLLEYFVGEQETFLFVLTREKLKAIIPLSGRRISAGGQGSRAGSPRSAFLSAI
jgi:tetratricopeptide (TPR) repeat protein